MLNPRTHRHNAQRPTPRPHCRNGPGQVTLADSGDLHWRQNQAGYRQALCQFHSAHLRSLV